MAYDITRRDFAKGILASALALTGLESIASEPLTTSQPSPIPPFNDFKETLKPRKTDSFYLANLWEQMNEQEKTLSVLAYKNEKAFLKNLPETLKNGYLKFTANPREFSNEEINALELIYTPKYPWLDYKNLSNADKWLLYLDSKKIEEFSQLGLKQREEYYERLRKNHGIKVEEAKAYQDSKQKPRSKMTKEEKLREIEEMKKRFQGKPKGVKGLYQELQDFLYK